MHNRRLMAVLAAAGMILALVGGAVLWRSRTLDERAQEYRAKGLEAAEAGDYVTALDQVGRYLQRFGRESDAKALYAYAEARRHVPLPNGKHLYDAIGILRRTLDVDPGQKQARQDLLDLYLSVGYGKESLTLARQILERNPDDLSALRAEAITLGRMREYEQALSRTAHVARLNPEDTENHNLALEFMSRLNRPAEELLAYADHQQGLNPGTAPYQLVMATANELTGNRAGAIEWAERAAANVPDDVKLVLLTDRLLAALGRHRSALEFLEEGARKTGDAGLERMLARRLFEGGIIQEFMERTESLPVEKQDATLLGLRAIGHASRKEPEKVKAIVAELESRKSDNAAKAWAPFLRVKFLEAGTPQAVLAACKEAIKREPANPYFHYFIGWAYEQLSEPGLALQAWDLTRQLSPGWIDPVLRSAAVLASTGRSEEANGLALEALDRAPQSVEVATTMAVILGTDIEGLSDGGRQQLFNLVDSIQKTCPMETRTLPLYIALVARTNGREEAKAKVQAALDSGGKFPEETLLQLARVSDSCDLGLADACRGRIDRTLGPTVSLTLARAMALHENGDSDGGRKLLLDQAQAAGNTVDWLSAIAQYLERVGADNASSAWATVSDAAPENAAVQQRVLASDAVWRDLGLVEKVVARLKAATGDDGAAWRAAKARWLLETDRSAKAAAEASALLTDAVRTSLPNPLQYSVMAKALERLGDAEGAIDNLAKAAQLDPDSNAPKFELVRLHQSRGNYLGAEPYLEQIARAKNLSPKEAHRLAELLADQGQIDRAIEVLLNTFPPQDREAPADVLLARLYRSSGQMDKAEAVAKRLLEANPDALAIGFIADLLAVRGQADEAKAVLARLEKMKLSPGLRESLLAEYERNHGNPAEAKRLYDAAVAAAPHDPDVWRRCIDFAARNRELERAVALIPKAHAACPDDELFTELAANQALLRSVGLRPIAEPYLLSAMSSPERLPEILESLRAINAVPESEPARLATELLRLSNRYPRFLPLKLQLARLYSTLGRRDEAARVASQTMRDFPGAIEAARAAAETLPAVGRWEEAMRAAQDWRRRSAVPPKAADVVIASAQIELLRPAEALETLRPYVDGLQQDYKVYSPVCHLYARALVGVGRVDEAEALLVPRLEVSDRWRLVWISLAGTVISDDDVAVEWLRRVAALAPKDSLDEQLALASAWSGLADRNGNQSLRDRAREILEALSNRPDVTGRAALALGMVADRDRDYPKAETSYRLALKLDPDSALAKNNLAMLLANQGQNLDEALSLAQAAVQAEPGSASFVDTLGSICAARGDYDGAVKQMKRAVQLEPGEQQWRDRLAELERRRLEVAQAVPSAG